MKNYSYTLLFVWRKEKSLKKVLIGLRYNLYKEFCAWGGGGLKGHPGRDSVNPPPDTPQHIPTHPTPAPTPSMTCCGKQSGKHFLAKLKTQEKSGERQRRRETGREIDRERETSLYSERETSL